MDQNLKKRILEKHGGAMPMHLRDADTGKTLYDNRDATAMAKQFVAVGGHAFYDNQSKWSSWDDLSDKLFREEYKCPRCNATSLFYINAVQDGQKFADGSTGFRCTFCWQDTDSPPYKDEKHKAECEFKRPYIDRYLDANKEGRIEIIKEYLEATKSDVKIP